MSRAAVPWVGGVGAGKAEWVWAISVVPGPVVNAMGTLPLALGTIYAGGLILWGFQNSFPVASI